MALSDWDSKAQETFGKIMEVVPEPMREGMQPQLIGMIEGKAAGAPVTDEVIERLVREDMPEPQKSVIMGALGMSEDAPKAAEAEAAEPAQLTWEGDSENMVDKILGVIPEMLRGAVKPKLLDFIKTKAGPSGVVTDSLVVSALQEMNPPEPYKSQYKEKQGILRDLLRRIKITHDGNKMLIERTLSFQERSFMLLFGLTRQHVRYGSAGDVQHDQKHLFDSKA